MTGANKIRLFVDAHSFDTEFQGAQSFLYSLYTSLMRLHPEIEIYFGANDTERLQQRFPQVKKQYFLKYPKYCAGLLRFFTIIPFYIRKYRFGFAHFQYMSPLPMAYCRYIVTSHDVLFMDYPAYFPRLYGLKRFFFFKWSFRMAAIKTTVSVYSRERLAFHYNIPVNDIFVIPNMVEEDAVPAEADLSRERDYIRNRYRAENYILYISRIEPRKNQLLLLQAYLKLSLREKNTMLVLIGKTSIRVKDLDALLHSLEEPERSHIKIIPAVEPDVLAMFYRNCRLFVYPSAAEGFGIPPLEAAMHGAPVLCANVTAMKDFTFFEPWRFDPANVPDFENKLADCINGNTISVDNKRIRSAIRASYDPDTVAADFFQLLKKTVI
ncbi:MAG: glycosyltransferase family 1 protein [Bacteroidota bacterium]